MFAAFTLECLRALADDRREFHAIRVETRLIFAVRRGCVEGVAERAMWRLVHWNREQLFPWRDIERILERSEASLLDVGSIFVGLEWRRGRSLLVRTNRCGDVKGIQTIELMAGGWCQFVGGGHP